MYLVIDIGGTYTKYGYYQKDGHCLKKSKIPTVKTNLADFYNSLTSLIKDDVVGIAISMPGIIESQTGYVHAITLLPFLANHSLKQELEDITHLPVSIENDAKCAALGEMWKGSLQNAHNALMIVFGSGIGGTLILDGKIYNSHRHKAGEIGSILMNTDDTYRVMTNFGKNNSANALITSMSQMMGCLEDGQVVFEKIHDHPTAYQHFLKYCRQIAFMIYNLDYILDLDVVCIGGGISEQPILITTIQQEFQKLRQQYQEDEHQPIITACHYYNDANLLGALKNHIS